MGEIRLAVVTAKANDKTKKQLNEMIGEDRVKYFEPFSYAEMQKLAAAGFSKEEIAAERFDKFRNIDARFIETKSKARMGNV